METSTKKPRPLNPVNMSWDEMDRIDAAMHTHGGLHVYATAQEVASAEAYSYATLYRTTGISLGEENAARVARVLRYIYDMLTIEEQNIAKNIWHHHAKLKALQESVDTLGGTAT